MAEDNLIVVKNLKKQFATKKGLLKAVDDISFEIPRKTTLSLVGESGCGKTTCGRTILGLYDKTSGEIFYDGMNIDQFRREKGKEFYRRVQMIFQDPYSCLDPRMNVQTIITEGRNVHYKETPEQQKQIAADLLRQVGLPEQFLARYPHELSGGQRQRVGIARALAVDPEFIICDEPTAALDVSIQAQVVNLLIRLQQERNLTYLFISHNLALVRHISDQIAVMYLGAIVEKADCEELFNHPCHPYTEALFASALRGEKKEGAEYRKIELRGELPSPVNVPQGCRLCTRCPFATDKCRRERPELKEVAPGHTVACHLVATNRPVEYVRIDLEGANL